MGLIFIGLIFVQVIPGFFIFTQGFSNEYIEGFEWIGENTPEGSTILSVPEEGHLISYISKRKNVVDSESLLVDYNIRKKQIIDMYTEKFKTNIFEVVEKYDVDYIILSNQIQNYDIKIKDTIFFTDPCFELVYNKEIKVFKVCQN
jgi:hypothetical protein